MMLGMMTISAPMNTADIIVASWDLHPAVELNADRDSDAPVGKTVKHDATMLQLPNPTSSRVGSTSYLCSQDAATTIP